VRHDMISFKINLSYLDLASNTRLRQVMIQLSYLVSYLDHQMDHVDGGIIFYLNSFFKRI